nr:unnamed protein product [Callosobruchus analis]
MVTQSQIAAALAALGKALSQLLEVQNKEDKRTTIPEELKVPETKQGEEGASEIVQISWLDPPSLTPFKYTIMVTMSPIQEKLKGGNPTHHSFNFYSRNKHYTRKTN